MNIGLYQSAASMSALERWQDAVAQNINGSQTPGYLKRTVSFSGENLGQWQTGENPQTGEAGTPAIFPKTTGGVSFAGGDTQPTGRDLDVAIQGDGFFEVQMPDGSHAFTRNGEFSVRADHTIVNSSGGEVMSDSGSPITTSVNGGKITINQDGTILQGGTAIGRLGIQRFSDTSQLTPIAGGMFSDPGTAGAEPVEKPELMQGYVAASNVTPMREMVDMVLISRSYEANQKLITTADNDAQKTLDALG